MRRALFLDRDGVINRDDTGYTYRWEDFVFIEGIFDLCRHAKTKGYSLFVITNQAGIGRGLYTEVDFLALSRRMCEEFERQGAAIDKVYFDPTHPAHGIGEYRRESPMRKPNPGMILLAAEEFTIALQDSVLIGDKVSDIQAGLAAGVGCNLLYRESRAGALQDLNGLELTAAIGRLEQATHYLCD